MGLESPRSELLLSDSCVGSKAHHNEVIPPMTESSPFSISGILALINQLYLRNSHVTERDLFYTEVKLFQDQTQNDAVFGRCLVYARLHKVKPQCNYSRERCGGGKAHIL
ncbi:hypothetical protein Bca52824_021865 [Brassica carinata]|uniref:Spo11/DNA topoisomerase VI subunit A N-terminal domain-containing protein n=1 Tax=Brassica carinata TaxID=52824 RepID=A0A8X7VF31_BRACI|nr:hypothetical protein Bca52824_021865 [Brassica carinata]